MSSDKTVLETYGNLNLYESSDVLKNITDRHVDVEKELLCEYEYIFDEDKMVFDIQLIKVNKKKFISIYRYKRNTTRWEVQSGMRGVRPKKKFISIYLNGRVPTVEEMKNEMKVREVDLKSKDREYYRVILPIDKVRGVTIHIPVPEDDYNWFSKII